MAKKFNLDEVDDYTVRLIASINEKDYAYNLLRSSGYNDEQKEEIDCKLSDEITIEDLDKVIHNLKMNQAESLNPGMKEIKQQLDNRLNRDGD